MIGSSTILQEASALSALIQVLADPVKTKAQLEELRKTAQDASDAEKSLVGERMELQSVRSLTESLINDSDGLVREADSVVKRANKMVDEAILRKTENSTLAISVVAEARDIVTRMTIAAQDIADKYGEFVKGQEEKIVVLDIEIGRKEKRLEFLNGELEKLKEAVRSET